VGAARGGPDLVGSPGSAPESLVDPRAGLAGARVVPRGKVKVADLGVAALVDEDIERFHVAVQNPRAVQVRETARDVKRKLDRTPRANLDGAVVQVVVECAVGQKLHHDPHRAVGKAHAPVDVDHRRRTDLRERREFPRKVTQGCCPLVFDRARIVGKSAPRPDLGRRDEINAAAAAAAATADAEKL
jgi:hypothetical protein